MDEAAELAERLIRLVVHTRSLLLRVLIAVNTPGQPEQIVYAAQALREMRGPLASAEVKAETLASVRRAASQEARAGELKDVWEAGIAEGIRRERARVLEQSGDGKNLHLVRAVGG